MNASDYLDELNNAADHVANVGAAARRLALQGRTAEALEMLQACKSSASRINMWFTDSIRALGGDAGGDQ